MSGPEESRCAAPAGNSGAPTTPAAVVAAGVLDGLAVDQEDILPDPNAQAMGQTSWRDPKAFERAFAVTAA